jgi:hypothetical protein
MNRSLAIIQPHYIPWIGFFDLIGGCDDVVLLDTVQYSKNSFFNRNRLCGTNGPYWLTIPVVQSRGSAQLITDVEVNGSRWVDKHMRSVETTLSRAAHYSAYAESWQAAYNHCRSLQRLADIAALWIRILIEQLRIKSRILQASSLGKVSTDRNHRLIELCQQLNASTYRTGPRGLDYLNLSAFSSAGISVEVIRYDSYSPLSRNRGPVSILQDLAENGADAQRWLTHVYQRVSD